MMSHVLEREAEYRRQLALRSITQPRYKTLSVTYHDGAIMILSHVVQVDINGGLLTIWTRHARHTIAQYDIRDLRST